MTAVFIQIKAMRLISKMYIFWQAWHMRFYSGEFGTRTVSVLSPGPELILSQLSLDE